MEVGAHPGPRCPPPPEQPQPRAPQPRPQSPHQVQPSTPQPQSWGAFLHSGAGTAPNSKLAIP